ncbi:site-specific DNA-methyltransferase [Nitrospira sp. BLG_1]|uniref:site-specific DNA-methyltransferase n=1 Tax=Nitrospira sp. BLG_1 TaxID=3395883 RepID=UPI0039BD7003
MAKKQGTTETVEALKHDQAKRKNIPTAEYQSVLQKEEQNPVRIAYERRNRDLDPQLVWRGKDEQDWSDLVVHAPPLYIQEKVHPKALIDDLLRETKAREYETGQLTPDLFADFNGIPKGVDKTEFYQHDQNWSNRMILGDSLQVMASLAEREGLRGRVQCIYFDPPYGIKFNSNFQWSTTSRDVKDGNADHITREPEQVKAFRDTWRDGIHSYLTYLRDRLTVARDLLSDSGSIFVQIGDENVHRVRAVMDEVFGDDSCVSVITLKKTAGQDERLLNNVADYIIWFARSKAQIKFRDLFDVRGLNIQDLGQYGRIQLEDGTRRSTTAEDFDIHGELKTNGRPFQQIIATSSGHGGNTAFPVKFQGQKFLPTANRHWSTHPQGFRRLVGADRIAASKAGLRYVRFFDDFVAQTTNNIWTEVGTATDKKYVVETGPTVIQRCILMTSDPGDLVLDPTCGSGTAATVAEQWGRRWITIDTSRVALALARARIMGARYPYYLLADSREGQIKEAEVTRTTPSSQPVQGNIRHGFVYERVPHITLKSIANNAEIDVIWDKWRAKLEPLRESLNRELKKTWQEWEIPREAEDPWDAKTREMFYELQTEQKRGVKGSAASIAEWLHGINRNLKRNYTLKTLPEKPADAWPEAPAKLHADWWQARIARQHEIDKSIAAKAEFEYLYDKPYEDKKKVRVAGPFTVESLSPHRVLGVDENDELIDTSKESTPEYGAKQSFAQMILDNLKTSGVQQAHKANKITFTSLILWPGDLVCAEGRYLEGDKEKRAAIFIGPEFGTVTRPDLVEAAREAGDAGFDVLIACAFNYDAHSTEFSKLGRIPVLKARMNADLHMADDLKNTGRGNLFVIFGEPDIDILKEKNGKLRVKVKGVDVFKPQTGEVISDGAEGIACWFIDTDYNEESFFVRHAYFLGANDPYSSLKITLKAEIDPEAWATLNSDTSRAFDKPKSGRIAVKVINHLGDEVMKVFRV